MKNRINFLIIFAVLIATLLFQSCSENPDANNPSGPVGLPEDIKISAKTQCDKLTTAGKADLVIESSAPIKNVELVHRTEEPVPINAPDDYQIQYVANADIVLGNLNFQDALILQKISMDLPETVISQINNYSQFHIRVTTKNGTYVYSDTAINSQDIICSACNFQPPKTAYILPAEEACSVVSAEPFRPYFEVLYPLVGNYDNSLIFLGCDMNRVNSPPGDLSAYDGVIMFNISGMNLTSTLSFNYAKPFVIISNMDNGGGSNISLTVDTANPHSNIVMTHIMLNSGGSNVRFSGLIPNDKTYFSTCSSGGSSFSVNGSSASQNVVVTIPTP